MHSTSFYSFNLIDQYKSPAASISRGFLDAENDFKDGKAYFKQINSAYPPLEKSQLGDMYKEYAPWSNWRCGFGLRPFHTIALNLKDYGYNTHYVTAYNTRLISMIETERQ